MHNPLSSRILLPVAFLLACCTARETVPITYGDPTPIILSESGTESKSILPGSLLPDSYTIYASSFFTNLSEQGQSQNYFISKAFYGSGEGWCANPNAYWPLGGRLDFLFLACEDSAIGIGECARWNEANCTKGVTVEVADGKCLDSEILYAATLHRRPDDGSVPVRLKHAQSRLQFVISGNADILRIDRIVIENVHAGGTLFVSNDIFLDAEWSFRGHTRSNLTVPFSEGVIPSAASPSLCDILLPEQDACPMSLHYSLKSSPEDGWSTATSSVFHFKGGSGRWYSGRKTTYRIDFSFNGIEVTPSVEAWSDDEKNIDTEELRTN